MCNMFNTVEDNIKHLYVGVCVFSPLERMELWDGLLIL